jgi:hypothetical protein
MLSGRLVRVLEQNWEELARRLITSMRRNPELPALSRRPESDTRELVRSIVENLGYWLAAGKGEELKRKYEVFGRMRFEESVPLHEAVLRLTLLKDKMIGLVHEQGFPETALQLYAEEELEHRVCRYFDALVYHIVRGYEEAMRREVRFAS